MYNYGGNSMYDENSEVHKVEEGVKPYDIKLMTGKTPLQPDTKIFIMEYDSKLITINLEEKEIKHHILIFTKLEELIATYREKRDALFMGMINYNVNFKIYGVTGLKEINLEALDSLL